MPARRDAGLVVVVMALWAVNMGGVLGGGGQWGRGDETGRLLAGLFSTPAPAAEGEGGE